MLAETEELKKHAPQRLAQWEQQVVTRTETVGWFVDHLAFALCDNSDAEAIVSSVITSLPKTVLARLLSILSGSSSRSKGVQQQATEGP
jgi:hypothetical protein